MKKYRKLVTIALVAGTGVMAMHPADAWWGGGDRYRDYDWWDRPGYYRHGGPYGWGGYPGYGGWGGYPGYGGWGGYPGYGWGGYAPAGSSSSQSTPPPPPRPE